MKVIIAGPRSLDVDHDTMREALEASGFDATEIVQGGATGVDASAARFAEDYLIPARVFRPKWGSHGKAAGPIRNREMAEYADALIVIRREGEATKGTQSMLNEAHDAGLPVYVHEVIAEVPA